MRRGLFLLPAFVLAIVMFAGKAQAQPQGGQGGFGGDPAQIEEFRRQAAERMKEQLGATDEEWGVLQPKIDAVQTAQRNAATGRGFGGRGGGGGFGGGGGGGGFGGGGPGGPGGGTPSPLATARTALNTVLEDTNASPEAIAKALADYRAARTKANDELTAARKGLQDVVTPRQEAVLVGMGMLE